MKDKTDDILKKLHKMSLGHDVLMDDILKKVLFRMSEPSCFNLSDVEIWWFEKMLKGLSREQRLRYDYPEEIPLPRLKECLSYLKSDNMEKEITAFEYLFEASEVFRKFSEED